MSEPERKTVLITRFSAIGDVAMTVPVVYSACMQYSHVQFVFVTRPLMTSIFVNPPANLQVVGVDVKNKYKGLGGLRTLAGELYDTYRPDIFIDLHDVLRTRIIGFFLRIKGIRAYCINKGRRNKRALTRRRNKVMLPLISSRARYRDAFFRAGYPIQELFQGLYGKGLKADPSLFTAITAPKAEGERWIGVAPFAAHPGKIYPLELMEEVVAHFAHAPYRLFVFGSGGNEQATAEAWQAKYPAVTSLAGKRYGFATELALLSHLDVMVTMDSANMHLASIVRTPTVSIWGATHPYCGFKGWHQKDTNMVQLPLRCRPCSVFGNKPCYRGDFLCMSAIRPDTVIAKVNEILSAK